MRLKTEDRRPKTAYQRLRTFWSQTKCKPNEFFTFLVFSLWSLVFGLFFLTGCINTQGNVGNVQSYPIPALEAPWIRNGEPIAYEGELWYPADSTESLQDSEVFLIGEQRGIQFFVDKLDVRPYNRLYTKFGRNKFRYFKKRINADDPGFASHEEF